MESAIGIPRVLWESLEVTLWTHSRNYVRELARHLGVKEDVLLKEVLPSKDVLKVYIQEAPADSPYDLECKALVADAGAGPVAYRCRKTIEKGYSYCTNHIWNRLNVQARMNSVMPIPKVIRRIRHPELDVPMWVDDAGSVWNYERKACGYYDSVTRKLYLLTT